MKILYVAFVATWITAGCVFAQEIPQVFSLAQNPFFGGRVSGPPPEGDFGLSLADAIHRGLQYNLGLYESIQRTRSARAARLDALGDLLPNLQGHVTDSVQQINLAAFGFPPTPAIPSILGPFTVFDLRAALSLNVLDFNAIYNLHKTTDRLKAAELRSQDARDLVVLVVANLYLQVAADTSRVQAAESQLKTADALFKQATDLKEAGMVPGIDVLRAQVEVETRRQQVIRTRNDMEKQKLTLARAIGLPLSQTFHLTDPIQPSPEPQLTLEQALQKAFQSRGDYLAAVAEAKGAEASKKAATSKYFPSLMLQADFGTLGTTPPTSHSTYNVLAGLRIPIFDGGTRSDVLKAQAEQDTANARLEDLRSQIEQQVRTAFLDLTATHDQVEAAQRALDLAQQQMEQAQDRFAAGVANNLEVVQAQEGLALANENYISSLFAGSMAKALLARATGGAEATAKAILGGTP